MREYFGTVIQVLQRINEDGPIGIDPQYLCPHYSTCVSAKALSMDFCSRYKCNTFYHLKKQERAIEENRVRPDIAKIIEQHLHRNSNGNGHNGSGGNGHNGRIRRISPISESFSK